MNTSAPNGGEMMSANIVTPKELADELGVDAKTLRRVMRSMTDADSQPGSGARWEIEIGSDFEIALRDRLSRTHNRKVVRATLKRQA
jgi:hypothetical protein